MTDITLNGTSVPFTVQSINVKFVIPQSTSTCDVDGRPIRISVTSSSGVTALSTKILIKSAMQLDVGQSHIYTPSELACIQLPDTGDYVLSVLNLRREPAVFYPEGTDTAWTITTVDSSGALTSKLHAVMDRGVSASRNIPMPRFGVLPPTRAHGNVGSYTGTSTPYVDPNLATAQVGDSVKIVDYASVYSDDPKYPGSQAATCNDNRATAKTIYAKVIAVSGRIVVLVDPRVSNAATLMTEGNIFGPDAAQADKALLPVLRNVISASYTPEATAGGRIFALITWTPPGEDGTPDAASLGRNEACFNSDELNMLDMNYKDAASHGDRTILHEMSNISMLQVADKIQPGGNGPQGWAIEGFDANVDETNLRFLQGQTSGKAIPNGSNYTLPSVLPAAISSWSSSLTLSNFRNQGEFVLKAREDAGQTDPNVPISGQTLFERMVALDHAPNTAWKVDELAPLVGLTGNQLLDQWVTATLTNDLVDKSKVAQYSLPQYLTWSNVPPTEYNRYLVVGGDSTHIFVRGSNALNASLAIGWGSYQYWYILPGRNGMGFSAKISATGNAPSSIVKVTRIR